ncbi:dGTPase, partial [Vibrio sp. 10N.222.49.E5]
HQRQLRARDWMPAKGIYDHDEELFNWVLEPLSSNDRQLIKQKRKSHTEPLEHNKTKYKSLDCSIMELADDITYDVHDLEDAIVLGSVTKAQWVDSAYPQLREMADPWICKH